MNASKVALARRIVEVMKMRARDVAFRLSGTPSKRYAAPGGEIPGIAGSMLSCVWRRMERDGLAYRIARATGSEVFAIEPTSDAAGGVLVSLGVARQHAPSVGSAVAADWVTWVPVAAR